MYPGRAAQSQPRSRAQRVQTRNPERAAYGYCGGRQISSKRLEAPNSKSQLKHTQFADFHSHGWVFRAVYKHDRKGNLLDAKDNVVPFDDPEKFGKAVHLKDYPPGKRYALRRLPFLSGRPRQRQALRRDAKRRRSRLRRLPRTINARATLKTSGPAAPGRRHRSAVLRTPWGERRFYWQGDRLFQRSMVEPSQEWEIVQVIDSITPGNPNYNEKSRLAKTMQKDGTTWGGGDMISRSRIQNSQDDLLRCHSAWVPTCFGCHLPDGRPTSASRCCTTKDS